VPIESPPTKRHHPNRRVPIEVEAVLENMEEIPKNYLMILMSGNIFGI
jgi:hypothetical protein